MAQFLNFKVMEVTGATKEEALNKAPIEKYEKTVLTSIQEVNDENLEEETSKWRN